MALDSYALTSLQKVLDLLGTSTTPNPTLVESMINTASRQIIKRSGREFKPLDPAVTTRVFPITTSGLIDFAPYEPRTITQIRANTETSTPTTLAAVDYQLEPGSWGGYGRLQLFSNWFLPLSPITGYVEVTGTWGWSSVPADIEWLCRWQVAQWVRRDLQARSNILANDIESPQVVQPFPTLAPSVARYLDETYRTPVVA